MGPHAGVAAVGAAEMAAEFWNMTHIARFMAHNAFFEAPGLIGGLVLVTVLDDRRDPRSHGPAIR